MQLINDCMMCIPSQVMTSAYNYVSVVRMVSGCDVGASINGPNMYMLAGFRTSDSWLSDC